MECLQKIIAHNKLSQSVYWCVQQYKHNVTSE